MRVGVDDVVVHDDLCVSPAHTLLIADNLFHLFYQFPLDGFLDRSDVGKHVLGVCGAEECGGDTWIAHRELHGQFLDRIILRSTIFCSLAASGYQSLWRGMPVGHSTLCEQTHG